MLTSRSAGLKGKLAASMLAAAVLLIAGCGFQLRGSGQSAILPFDTLFVEPTGIGVDVKRRLARSGATTLVENRKDAQAVMELLAETRDRQILSLNSQGRVREFTLNYRVTFRIRDNANRELRPATQVVISRTLSFNESQVLAKEGEEQTLYRDMQNDMVSQLLRRLAATRPWEEQQRSPAPGSVGSQPLPAQSQRQAEPQATPAAGNSGNATTR